MNFHGYSIRLTKNEDTAMVQTMLHPKLPDLEKLFGKIDIPKICEMSLYSLVAFSAENKLVAFAAFDDNPMATLPPGFPHELADKAGRWAVQAALDLGYRREMLLWTTLCANVAVSTEDEHTLHKAMLSSVLVLSTDTMVILETSAFEFGCLRGLLKPMAYYQKQDFRLSVCSCRRRSIIPLLQIARQILVSFLFPKLIMRRAREEDQDDLAPVIEHAQQRGFPLTQVPESACPSKPFAVARLIAAQNKQNSVFVAQVGDRIMGVIALTSDVHLPSLHENYDLDCFEGLMSKIIERKLTVIAKKEVDKFFVDPLAAAVTEPEEEVTEQPEEPAAPTVERFIRWPENAFRIAMLCMEIEYESRAIDVIEFAFSKLNKEFCLVTLPYVSPYRPLLHCFYRVPARLHASNEDPELSADTRCLYLLHVDALSPGFAIRPFKPADLDSLGELLDNFRDKDRLLDSAFSPPEGRVNMVAVLSNQVVGFVMLDNTAPVGAIASNFDLQSLLQLQHHPFEKHATMVVFVLNPVYRYRSRLFLQEIMRQMGKSIIYCPVFPLMEIPDVLEDLILVSGRQHAHMAPPCHWTVPPPDDDAEDVLAERSSTRSAFAERLAKETQHANPDERSDIFKTDQKTLDVKAEDSLKARSVTAPAGEKRSVAYRDQKMEGVSAPSGVKTEGVLSDAVLEKSTNVEGGNEKTLHVSAEAGPTGSVATETGVRHGSAKVGQEMNVELIEQKAHDISAAVVQEQNAKSGHEKTQNISTKNGQERNAKSRDQKTQDVPSAVGPRNNAQKTQSVPAQSGLEKGADASVQKTQDVSAEVFPENNAGSGDQKKQDVSGQGGPEKNADIAVGERKSITNKDHKDKDSTGKKDTSQAGEGKSDAVGDAQRKAVSADGDDSSSTVEGPQLESDVPPPCPPVRRGYYHGFDCALYVLTHKYLYRYKTVINARIVVVGSSITTAGFLHELLASHELQFTNLIMVSNVGFNRLSSTSLSSLIADLGPKHSFPKLGLDCQIKIIIAVVKGINRKARTVQLSTGEDLAYDWLVLSSGLQDQTKHSLGLDSMHDPRGIVKADELVLNAAEIAKGIAASAGKGHAQTIAPVVVYGATLEAYGAVQALLEEGLEGHNMLLIHPDTVDIETAATKYLGDTETSQIILATLIQAGLSIHSGLKLIHVEKNSTTGWISGLEFQDLVEDEALDGMSLVPTSLEKLATKALKPVVALEELLEASKCPIHRIPMGDREALKSVCLPDKAARPERNLKLQCSLLVTCDKRQVDLPLFQAINKEALIFDGRIVIDGYFQTNDPLIFAAGSLCKFSRHCGDNLPKLETFCPWEVGEALARAFKAVIVTSIYEERSRCASQEDIEILKPHKWPRPNLPSLKKARYIGGFLPGEQWFLSATSPKFCTPVAGSPALSLNTRTPEAYSRLDIMDNKEVGRIIYFGKTRLEEWKIVCFVGLPETLLNDLVHRWESNQVDDIAKFLFQPWAAIIFHDRFPSFFQGLSEAVRDVMRNSRKSMAVFVAELAGGRIKSLEPQLMKASEDMVRNSVLRFLKQHENDLPKYSLPWKVE